MDNGREGFVISGIPIIPLSEEEESAREQKEANLRLLRIKEHLESHYKSPQSGIPEAYLDVSFKTYIPQDKNGTIALKRVIAFADEPMSKVLILRGPCGTGKTHLGCSIVRACGGFYVSILKLLKMLDASRSFHAKESELDILSRICSEPMLVLDEVGRGVREDVQIETVCYILSERYAARKPTVIISNMTKDVLAKWLGVPVKDRLNEVGAFIELTGESYRKRKRTELYRAV